MRKYHVVLIVLALCVTASPALAWEIGMTGTFTSEYRYLTQMGTNGFFGPYAVMDSIGPSAASETPNLFTGIHFQQISNLHLSSSSDVATHGMWADFDPEIRFNPAVRLRGRYRIGRQDWGSGTASIDPIYYNSFYGGVNRKFADGGWSMLWATAQLPMGILAVGKRPFAFGCGLHYDGTTQLSTESILLVAAYGPLRIGGSFYPARFNFGLGPGTPIPPLYLDYANKSGINISDTAWFITYANGPLEVGTFFSYGNQHRGPEGGVAGERDRWGWHGTSYMKYNNGFWFTNAELSYSDQATYTRGSRPMYQENTRWMIEWGFMAGPMKVSNIYAAVTGGQRGTATGVTALAPGPVGDKVYSNANFANTVVFKPYSLLMVRNYGVGTQFNLQSWEGSVDNAWVLGTRGDYAIAANLNLWLSGFAAWRLDRDTNSWACVRPQETGLVTYAKAVNAGGLAINPAFIPNDDIGYEIYGGVDWKLLEGLRITAEAAYFVPGLWWRHACSANTAWILGAPDPTDFAAMAVGNLALTPTVNADRTIDPIMAFYLSAYFEF